MNQGLKTEGGARIRGGWSPPAPHEGPLVSIVTIVKNARRTVSRAIESVLGQTYTNFEYIVVDGGSTDGTLEVVRSFGPRIAYWMSEPDEGISDAFNKGIALSSGEIVGLLNADDAYERDALARVVAVFQSDASLDVVYGAVAFWDGKQRRWVMPSDPRRLSKRMSVQHPATFVRRRRYEQSGVFRTDFRCAMDYELLLRFCHHGARCAVLPDVLANMWTGGRSDVQWHRGIYEVALAQRCAGASWPRVAWTYCRGMVDRTLRRILSHVGLPGGIRELHRRRSSS